MAGQGSESCGQTVREWLRLVVEIGALAGLIVYVRATVSQIEIARRSQRASVNLGLPDGRTAEFSDKNDAVLLWFRNNGQNTGTDIRVEPWPLVFPPQMSVEVPALKSRPLDASGHLNMPPGIPNPFPVSIPSGTRLESVRSGERRMAIIGRISHGDGLGGFRCETFCTIYQPGSLSRFVLCSFAESFASTDLCDGHAHKVPNVVISRAATISVQPPSLSVSVRVSPANAGKSP